LKGWVRERLSNHLVPKHIILAEGHFPKTASGKIQKFKLQAMGDEYVRKLVSGETPTP
jgi:acyl-coenzyme A synthetase/AMP-(fatty) acid ligase